MRRDRPACVAGFGGYPALPAMIAAKILKRAVPDPRAERRARAGQPLLRAAGRRRRLRRLADGGARGARAVHVGNPVRATVLDAAGGHLHRAGGSSDRPSGDRRQPGGGALRPRGARGVAAGAGGLARAAPAQPAGAPRGHGPGAGGLRGDGAGGGAARLLRRRARAAGGGALVVSRAGASSIADITVIGRPAILVPYPHAMDDHQAANAPGWFPPAAPS